MSTSILNSSYLFKVKKKLENSLASIPSPSTSVKIQIMVRKDGLRFKAKTLLVVVNKLFCTKFLLTTCSNAWPKNENKNSNVQDSLKVIGSNPDYLLESSLLYELNLTRVLGPNV